MGLLFGPQAGAAAAPSMTEPVMGFPAIAMKPAAPDAPPKPKREFADSPFGRILGAIGDALLVNAGRAPMYAPQHARREEARRKQEQANAVGNYLGQLGVNPALIGLIQNYGVDPETVLSLEDKRLGVNGKRLKTDRDVNDYSMQLLGGSHDQPSYDAARRRVAEVLPTYGSNADGLQLPEVYDPQTIRDLRLRGMDTAHQMGAIDREDRTAWNIADDQADNARADQNAKSLQDYRRGQLANTRRGQDMTDRRGRRGQDMTDTRVKGSAAYRGRNSRPSVGDGAIIRNRETGERMKLQGGRWVPIK